jgi:hypothetical protein
MKKSASLRECDDVLVAPVHTMLDVRAIGDDFAVLHDAITHASLRMVQGQNQNPRVRGRECSFDEINVFTRTRELRHIDWKVWIRHHSRQCIHYEIGIPAAGKVKREVITRVVERPKKREYLGYGRDEND